MVSIEIAEPLRLNDVDGDCGVLEFINAAKAGHLDEVEKRFGYVHSVLLLFRSRTFYLADNSAEGAFVVDMESFLIFAVETRKHPTRFAMPPVSSAGMTLWTGGHFYSPFTALAVHIFVSRLIYFSVAKL